MSDIREKLADICDAEIQSDNPSCYVLADAIIAAVLAQIMPLALLERRNGYWGGKCSHGYQVAHTHDDIFRVRLHGKVICRDIKGFGRAVKWANDHHVAQVMQSFGVTKGVTK